MNLSQFFTFRYSLEGEQIIKPIKVTKYDYSFKEYKERLKELMDAAVLNNLSKNEKVGCFLSGGIDSSAVCSILCNHSKNVHTFSVDFGETKYINKVVERLKTFHHCYSLKEEEVMPLMEKMVPLLPYPIGDPGILPFFFLSEKAKQHGIKKIFNGEGGDEVFCGYDKYKLYKYGRKIVYLFPLTFGNNILKRLKSMKGKADYPAFVGIIRLFDDKELTRLGVQPSSALEFWNLDYNDSTTSAQHFDLMTSVPFDFYHKGTVSKYYGVTQIAPMLDQEVINFAFSIPAKYKLKGWNEKYVLKEAYKEDLPIEITTRRKVGLPTPIDKWFKGSLGDKLEQLLDNSDHGFYNKEYIYQLLAKVRSSKKSYKEIMIDAQKLWSILVLELWIKSSQTI